MPSLRLLVLLFVLLRAGALAAPPGPAALPRRAAPQVELPALPEAGAVDCAPFRLKSTRWRKDARGQPVAAAGLVAVPAAVQALTDLPAEWPARVVFEGGKAVAAH